jgi:hypothetical protein
METKTKNLNAEFKKANKAQKRVMIAQDVLAQIKAKRYFAESGCWVQPNIKAACEKNLKDEDSVQELFAKKKIKSCNVCALGGLFMSCINLNNNTTVQDLKDETYIGDLVADDDKLSNGLNRIFTQKQLILIETYFEGSEGYFKGDDEETVTFFENYDDDERLEMIMQNIIDNNGTFKPNKLDI